MNRTPKAVANSRVLEAIKATVGNRLGCSGKDLDMRVYRIALGLTEAAEKGGNAFVRVPDEDGKVKEIPVFLKTEA